MLAANVLTALAKGVEDDASRLYDHRDGGSDVGDGGDGDDDDKDARCTSRGPWWRRESGRAGERASGEVW